MLVACWSPKGGTGTTVASVVLALCLARLTSGGALLADLSGDVPAALGVPDPPGPGLDEWLQAPADVGADALARLEVDVGKGVALLPRGGGGAGAGGAGGLGGLGGLGSGGAAARAEALVELLSGEPRPVVVDCGTAARSPGREVAAGATVSLAVLRPCYLGLRRALAAPVRPSGVLLLTEPGRALQVRDVEDVLGVPVWAVVDSDPAVARAVDAGLLSVRVPRTIERPLERGLASVAVR